MFTLKSNNFDIIKDKFDRVEPEIPYSMDSKFIKEMILNKQKHKVIKYKKSNIHFKQIASLVACFILIIGVAFTTNSDVLKNNKVATFNNYEELSSKLSILEKPSASGESGCGEFKTIMQIDEDGVTEPNTIKSFDNYIYYAYYDHNNINNRNKVYIYLTDKGKTKLLSIIDNFVSDDFSINDLIVNENRIVINASTSSKTVTKIYNISDKANPTLVSEFEQSGQYSTSRLIDKTLYVITNYNASVQDSQKSVPFVKQNNKITYALSQNISYFKNVSIAQYVVINTIDIETGMQTNELKAVLGGSSNIHCTKDYMYIKDDNFTNSKKNDYETIKLNLNNNRISYATNKEISEYSEFAANTGKGSNYSSVLYFEQEYFIGITENTETTENEIILFDKELNQLDIKNLTNAHIPTLSKSLAKNEKENVFAIPAYFTDGLKRCYGVITFEIENNHIVLTNEFKNENSDMMYQGNCIIINDYVYNVETNDFLADDKKVKIFSYKY